jgi:transcriptional regulator with XRE-family HTH domain
MRIGMKLRILRGDRTLKTVASAIGIAVSFLSDVERSKALPSLSTVQALADHYGVTLMEVFRDVRIDDGEVAAVEIAENVWSG